MGTIFPHCDRYPPYPERSNKVSFFGSHYTGGKPSGKLFCMKFRYCFDHLMLIWSWGKIFWKSPFRPNIRHHRAAIDGRNTKMKGVKKHKPKVWIPVIKGTELVFCFSKITETPFLPNIWPPRGRNWRREHQKNRSQETLPITINTIHQMNWDHSF